MRILFLATDAYGGHGGIALFNRQFCEALAALDEVSEIVVVPRAARVGVHEVPEKVAFVADAARGPIGYARALARAARRRFDLVVCGHINLLPAALPFGRPLLVTHGIEAWRPPRRRLSVNMIGRCRGVISVSALTRNRFVAWSGFAGPTFVLPNALPLGQYGVRARRLDLISRYDLAGKRVLLTLGRLDPRERYKGFDEVLTVLPELPGDVVYLIAGGGSDWERLREVANALGVAGRVRFTGLFDEAEKQDLYALADVFVMPSRGEGFGFVILEALACGIPVIGSKHDGTREALLNGELGLLVDPANPSEIGAAIREVLSRPDGHRILPGLDAFSLETFFDRVAGIIRASTRPAGSRPDSDRAAT